MVVRFSSHDLDLFAAASHDYNPLHTSASYARRTPYGQPVAFGILGALACLGRMGPQSVSKLTFEFLRPLLLDTDYTIEVSGLEIEMRDGSAVVLRSSVTPGGAVTPIAWDGVPPPARTVPADHAKFRPGDTVSGEYLPSREPFEMLLARFDLAPHLALPAAALLLSSYLVGMELPGERALYFKLALDFEKGSARSPLTYAAQILSVNALNLMRASLTTSAASGEVCAFIRPADSSGESDSMLSRGENLAGKVALVMGASRGLGASIAKALALQGCTVLANFQHSADEARKLPGKVILVPGDAGSVASCRAIANQCGRLDFLVCNACPPALPFRLEADTVARINAYVAQSLALVTVPMAAFLHRIAESRGWAVIISSVYVEEAPKEMPHYVAAKAALEGFARAAAGQYPQASFLLVRPPRMLTDMTKVPFGNENALHPDVVAAKMVARLEDPRRPEQPEILSWGSEPR